MSLNGSPKWMYNAGSNFYPYLLNQSLRFNSADSAYLSRTPASAGNRDINTTSFWVKRGNLGSIQSIFSAGTSFPSNHNNSTVIQFRTNDTLRFRSESGGSPVAQLDTTRVFRDAGWYHIVLTYESTNSTSTDRIKLYVNGVRQTAFGTTTYPSSGVDNFFTSASVHQIGRGTAHYVDGYLAEFNFLDGIAYDASYFGETKENIWIPKEYTGSYGTNGFYLKYVAGAEGTDSSGNGNNFTHTPGNTSRNRPVQDSPTNNFCVIPYSNNPSLLVKEHQGMRLNTSRTGYWDGAYGSFAVKSGKWYYEVQMNETAGDNFRSIPGWKLAPEESTIVFNRLGTAGGPIGTLAATGHYAYMPWSTNFAGNGGYVGTKATATRGDVLNVAVDFDDNKIYFGLNGTYAAFDGGTDGDPANGTNESLSGLLNNGKFYSPSVLLRNDSSAGSNTVRFNFGSDRSFGANLSLGTAYADENGFGEFRYPVPSGFLALCSQNLPDPAIDHNDEKNPTDHFNTLLYDGNATNPKAVTGAGFQPDFVWIKDRDASYNHQLHDVIRGADIALRSNLPNAEQDFDSFVSFDSDGFSVTGANGTNNSGNRHVAWNWKAGGTAVSNTDGNVSSSVSANTEAGFSIVSYTGTGSATTIGHGLSQAPEYIIVKNRDQGDNWSVGTIPGGNFANHIQLNATDAQTSAAAVFNDTNPTSTVFSVGTNHKTNASGEKYIAYCFHSVDGYSRVGVYEGNQNADGPIVNIGFRPAFVLFKNIDTAEIWVIYDNKRDVGNLVDLPLYPNLANSESAASTRGVDFLSSGFKIRGADTSVNKTSNTHVYLAFADQAFKYANAK